MAKTHPEGIYRCIAHDNPWSLGSFNQPRTKRQVNALYYVTIPTHPNTTSQPSLWITAKVSTSAWAELVSACKGNENNRKVVSFPIIFFKKHKGSVVWRHTNNHKSPLSILLWTNHPAPPRSECFANQHYAPHHTKSSSLDGGSSSFLSLAWTTPCAWLTKPHNRE